MKKILTVTTFIIVLSGIFPVIFSQKVTPVKYYVKANTGNDAQNGTSEATAFQTIQKAADMAMPGDTILVFAGVYRERVKPVRGGTGEYSRITYLANPGDKVKITGLDVWAPKWENDSLLHFATPASKMFTDSNYVDGGNPFKIGYFGSPKYCLGQVLVDGIEYKEQTSHKNAMALKGSWWSDQKTGTIYIHFDGSPSDKMIEITTRRGVFRPYLKGLGYITVQGFDLAYCGNNAGQPGVVNKLDPYYQSGLIGTRQGHHWNIIGNKIRKAKGVGLSFSLGTDWDDADCWDPHGIFGGKKQVEYDYAKSNEGDNEIEPENSQMGSMPIKNVGYNLIANNVFDSCGMNAIVGIGSIGNTIFGNRFSHCAYLISGKTAEDATIKIHMQLGTIIEKNLFENFPGNKRGLWLDNNVVASVVSRNVFLNHSGGTPTVFFEISSSLDQYLSIVDNNIFINCEHGIVSAGADGVAFYNNLFYKCGDGFSMGSNRTPLIGADYGNMRIHSWNNLFIDMERIYGFAYNQAVNFHTADFNLMYKPSTIPFCKFLLTDGGTGSGPGNRPSAKNFKLADISSAKTGGKYWKEGVNWGANNGPNGCEADFGYWKGTMGTDIDRHSQERNFIQASNTTRTLTLNLGSDPKIRGASFKKGAQVSFDGHIITTSKAGPFQDLGKKAKTLTFWDDNVLPSLPALPAAPTNLSVEKLSATTMKVSWKNNSPVARFMHVERRINGGEWQFWGYITTSQDFMHDYDLPIESNTYEYRIASRNAAGLSAFAYRDKY